MLRDGREAFIFVHRITGHGILDSAYWEEQGYYGEDYRNEFGAEIGKKVLPSDNLQIYDDLNERQFQTFLKHLTKETRLLEIGCSFGGILNRVANFGVAISHGVEPNKQDAEFVQYNNKKAKIFNSTFENANLPDDYYDIIVSIEVLEHIVSPRSFLQKCYTVLRRGGLIHIEVPNHNDALLNAYKNAAYEKFYYRKVHIHYFTKDSLLSLCRECGFEGSVISFLMYPFFNHVWWYQNNKPQSSATTALSTPAPADENTLVEKAINEFYEKVENEYETLINANMLGDCLIFQGQRIK